MKKILTLFMAVLLVSCNGQSKENSNTQMANPTADKPNLEYVTVGGGCFWCVEAPLESVKGIESVVSGYSGGFVANPTYEQVSTGETGHAEVVRIGFDPKVISYKQIMDIFFFLHDPTTLNRQGADVGPQYRSVVFYSNQKQKKETEEAMKISEASGRWSGKYVTQIVPFEKFYPAEKYHQNYYDKNPQQPYCSIVIGPKIAKFKEHYGKLGWLKPNS
ncbi:peptide-methionine (S)-S-oxide reductase [Halpernia humi]|uniref:Peptide methionine sulfoxide reductase MsrA n=1 Tax=Halpernia humi TaxID=493375 RepID=A0A1H5WQ88_9FLAO|nr:peptide-methionine (S)-S-oxide reductase MsrA [Halpernia humi]SEG01463.1 peptide-methionine (S)-S-oxide reductase [Halpernia humi]